jgi:hypothetical protein
MSDTFLALLAGITVSGLVFLLAVLFFEANDF